MNHTNPKFKNPATVAQWRMLCGVILPEVARVMKVELEDAHNRMRDRLIKNGLIKKSRAELTLYQVMDLTNQYTAFLSKNGVYLDSPYY